MRSRRLMTVRRTAALLTGVLALQTAWLLVVPPFRGLDEHDHAYKAAAVAGGDWRPDHRPSGQGWGEFVVVPEDLVTAARPICEELPYTTPDNCTPGAPKGAGQVEVSSSAARYNPAFYFVIGTPARAFSGADSLYVMRATGALVCAALLVLAGLATRRWSRTAWPVATLLLALTPMIMYSTAMAAPNGVEAAGGVLLWVSLLGLASGVKGRHPRLFVILAAVGAVPLVLVRTLGPLWLVLVVAAMGIVLGRAHVVRLLRERTVRWCAAGVALVAVAAVTWTLVAATNSPGSTDEDLAGSLPLAALRGWVLWVFQAVAAFPARDEMAPLGLYAIALPAWWLVTALALRYAAARERWALGFVVLMSTAVPVAVTVATYHQLGIAWQGRYGYPFAVGFILVAGYALDRLDDRWSRSSWPIYAAGLVVVTTQAIGQLEVLSSQTSGSSLAGSDAWLQPHPVLVVGLDILGTGLLLVGLNCRWSSRAQTMRDSLVR